MFYISSFGGSATLWLASSFSKHPDVVCFHGSQCFPPNPENRNVVSAREFVTGLRDCEYATRDRKIFGHVHGFHGLEAKASTEEAGGVFAGMLRHPLRRIHSLFTHYYDHRHHLPVENADIYQTIKSRGWASNGPGQSLDGSQFRLNDLERLFHWICQGTLEHDMACIEGLPLSNLIRMEDIIRDRAAFARVFRLVTRDRAEVSESFLDYCFEKNTKDPIAVNSHCLKRLDDEELYRQWPWSFKAVFALLAGQYGAEKVLRQYLGQGYQIPPEALDINLLLKAA